MKPKKPQIVVKKGKWLYDNLMVKEIRIIKQNWDYYYEYGCSDDEPHLNDEGFAFYLVFDKPLEDGSYLSRSETIYSLEEAVKSAEKRVHGTIIWE